MIYMVLSLFFSWLVVLSFAAYKVRSHYVRLTTRTRRQGIDEILDVLLRQIDMVAKTQHSLKKELNQVQSHLTHYYQKIGLVHFNAFGKAEGEQSFVLALLNEQNNGVVINFIYIHEGMRIYIKLVKGGKSDKHELSEEERQAIAKAQ